MIVLTQNNTNEKFVVTLNEKKTIQHPTYRFTCNDTNGNVVTFDISSDDDTSNYPNRYNEFAINTANVFEGQPVGKYKYVVTEVETNVVVEQGILELKAATEFQYQGYSSNTIYKGYGG